MNILTKFTDLADKIALENEELLDWVMEDKDKRCKHAELFDRGFKAVTNIDDLLFSATEEFRYLLSKVIDMADHYMDYFVRNNIKERELAKKFYRIISRKMNKYPKSIFSRKMFVALYYKEFIERFTQIN